MATYSNSQIRQRIDTKANWENTQSGNPTLASGEIALVTGMNQSDATNMDIKFGDGSSDFNSLPYVIANNKEVKAAKSTANSADSAASSASSASLHEISDSSSSLPKHWLQRLPQQC